MSISYQQNQSANKTNTLNDSSIIDWLSTVQHIEEIQKQKAYMERLLQNQLLQLKEQNRHNQYLLKGQTGGRLSNTHASAAHRARHERKGFRYQP